MKKYAYLVVLLMTAHHFMELPGAASEKTFDVEPTRPYSKEEIDALASKLGIGSEMIKLKSLNANTSDQTEQLDFLRAQNNVNKGIACVFFDANSAIADLTTELSSVHQRIAMLENKRNSAVATTNTVNFLTRGAIGIPASAYSIPATRLPTNGNILGVTANSVSTLLSVVALGQGRGGKDDDGSSSILAPLFFENLSHERFPPYVWDYLYSAPIGSNRTLSHKDQLVSAWIKSGLAADQKTAAGRKRMRHLLEMDKGNGLSISDLRKREKMLFGLRTTVMQMNKGLEQLTVSM